MTSIHRFTGLIFAFFTIQQQQSPSTLEEYMFLRFGVKKLGTTPSNTGLLTQTLQRGISTWLPTTSGGVNPTLSNEALQYNAQSIAKTTGTTYINPSDFRKGKFTTEQAAEPFHYIADQADIRKKEGMGGVIKSQQKSFDALKGKTREATLYSCHAGTDSNSGRRSSVLSSALDNIPVTAPIGQLKMNAEEFSPIEARVGKQDTLTSPFTTFPADKSLVTVKGHEVVPTPNNNVLQKAISDTLKRTNK